jgi:hypothetical protein
MGEKKSRLNHLYSLYFEFKRQHDDAAEQIWLTIKALQYGR